MEPVELRLGPYAVAHPWKAHYDLELGMSGQTGTWDDSDQHRWSAGVIDGALHLGSNVEIKGEYVNTWLETADTGTLHPHGWWVQGSYRLAGLNLDLPFVNNLEVVGRYDAKRDSVNNIATDRYTPPDMFTISGIPCCSCSREIMNSTTATIQVKTIIVLFSNWLMDSERGLQAH